MAVPALLWALVLAVCRGCCRLDYNQVGFGFSAVANRCVGFANLNWL